MTLTKLADDSKITFMSIDKEEQACLMNYFKTANVKMRTVDVETNIHQELGSDEEESAGEEANERSAGKRKIKKKKVEDEEMEDYDDEEDDEDFNEEGTPGSGSGSGSGEEEGEEE